MPCLLYNSKKQFWNPATRKFQKDPVEMKWIEKQLEYKMAIKTDDTVDCITYGEGNMKRALETIEKFDLDEEFMREMNREILDSL